MITLPEDLLFRRLLKDAGYARNSFSEHLVYLVYGKICMAYDLKAITKEEFFDLNDLLVRDCINNPEWFHRAHRSQYGL